MATAPSMVSLPVLVHEWQQITSYKKAKGLSGLTRPDKTDFQLSSVLADTTSGLKRPLSSLALLLSEICEVAQDDLEYLCVKEPDDEKWLCLHELGVLASADTCLFQMRCLQTLATTKFSGSFRL
jgi:hypothetical protein